MTTLDANLSNKLISILLVIGLAWGGIVWTSVNKISTLTQNMKSLTERVAELKIELNKHEEKEWHESAGIELTRNKQILDRLNKDLSVINNKLDILVTRRRNFDRNFGT